jgi:serine/threonine-protein kinase RsbW
MRIQVAMTLPREAASVPLVRRTASVLLTNAGLDPDCVFDVELALSEACTNVLLHAGGDRYEVLITTSDEQLVIDVLNPRTTVGHRPTWPAATLPHVSDERGRGLALMTALMDHAIFDAADRDGGSVHLIKSLRGSANAPLAATASNLSAHVPA